MFDEKKQNQPGEPEDIFAKIDQGSSQSPSKRPTPPPPVSGNFGPRPTADATPPASPSQVAPTQTRGPMPPPLAPARVGIGKKLIIGIFVVVAIGVLAFAAWYVYSSFFSKKMNTRLPELKEETGRPLIDTLLNDNNGEEEFESSDTKEKESEEAPVKTDSDKDGLSDADENEYGTSSKNPDSDDDGLNDNEEISIYKTDPLNPDTDGDTYLDGEEVDNQYDPNGPGRLFSVPEE